jgi:hypothetical protein
MPETAAPYDPRDIIQAIERLAVHDSAVAGRLLSACRLERLYGATLGYQQCTRLAEMAAAAGCADGYRIDFKLCEHVIDEHNNYGPERARELHESHVSGWR